MPLSPRSDVTPRQQKADALRWAPISKGATILCVDDEPDALSALGWFLAGEGFVIITAPSGAEALLRVQEGLPDFVITDYTMPGITGLELCRHLRERYETRHIPIIVYSGLRLPAESWLYDRTFIKPTDFHVFVTEIRALLAAPH